MAINYSKESNLLMRMLVIALASAHLDTDYFALDTAQEDEGIEIRSKNAPHAGPLFSILIGEHQEAGIIADRTQYTVVSWHNDSGSWPNHPPETYEKNRGDFKHAKDAIIRLISTMVEDAVDNALHCAFADDPAFVNEAWH